MSQLIPLAYSSNLQVFYEKLSHLPGFVLLESTDKKRGRFDLVSAFPYKRVDSLEQLTELKKNLCKGYSDLDLPFQGGAIGFISYDLGAQLMGLQLKPHPHLLGMPLLDLGFYDWGIIADHHLKTVTLFAAHEQSKTAACVDEVLQFWHASEFKKSEFELNSLFTPLMSQEQYTQAFQSIYSDLSAGRSYQVNLTQAFQAAYQGNPWEQYKEISRINPVPYSAFLRTEQADVLSFSPERFLKYEQGDLLTSPIKGTIARSLDPMRDKQLKSQLASSAKNRAENVMIVDLLRHDLGKIAQSGSVEVLNLCALQSYNGVHHLVSDIRAQSLDSISAFEAFLSCFPGGSITGAPKIEAMRIINEQEPFARGVYCGSVGYFSNHGRFDSSIAIRTLTAKKGILHLAAGGGIVIDSTSEEEYRECYTKIQAILNSSKKGRSLPVP